MTQSNSALSFPDFPDSSQRKALFGKASLIDEIIMFSAIVSTWVTKSVGPFS